MQYEIFLRCSGCKYAGQCPLIKEEKYLKDALCVHEEKARMDRKERLEIDAVVTRRNGENEFDFAYRKAHVHLLSAQVNGIIVDEYIAKTRAERKAERNI